MSLNGNPEWDNESRLYDEWHVETNLSAYSSIKLLEIIIPYSELDVFELKKKDKVHWVECYENSAASFGVFRANISGKKIISSEDQQIKELCRLGPRVNESVGNIGRV